MMDVEKYGMVGLAFVLGILGLVFFYGPDEEPLPVDVDQPAVGVSAKASKTVGAAPGARRAPRPKPMSASRPAQAAARPSAQEFTISSPMDGKGEFSWSEERLDYENHDAVQAVAGVPAFHEVRSGDTLDEIAIRYYGSMRYRDVLLKLNTGLDPKRLQIGQSLRLRASSAAEARALAEAVKRARPAPTVTKASSSTAKPGRYTVQAGDVLSTIAQKTLGSSKKVDQLFEANRDLLESPDKLREGMVLKIP